MHEILTASYLHLNRRRTMSTLSTDVFDNIWSHFYQVSGDETIDSWLQLASLATGELNGILKIACPDRSLMDAT
jgi:hypothetical protein